VARRGRLEFPAPGFADGHRVQIGFRPYYLKISEDPRRFRHQARLRHIYFLGVAYRLEIETEDGLLLRSRLNKEEFRQYHFEVGRQVSYAITHFRFLPEEVPAAISGRAPEPLGGPLTP
jgi:sulfate/thiosulfate transport system ATP-binding protein